MTPTRGEIKVRIEIERLQRIAKTKAPLCGVQWMERGTPLVIPTRLLKMALSHPGIMGASVAVYSNGTHTMPSEIEIRGKGFCYRLRHQSSVREIRNLLWRWAETEGKRARARQAVPEDKEAARQASKVHKAKERLRIETKRHKVERPRHPLRRPERWEFAGEETAHKYREHSNEQARTLRRERQIRQTLGRIVAPFLQARGRHWQAELKAALQARGLDVAYGFSRISRVKHGNWTEGDPEVYLKALWRDVAGMRYSGGYKAQPSDPAEVLELCREWRDKRLLAYLEWKQRERMLLQDICDQETGMHVEQAEGASDADVSSTV